MAGFVKLNRDLLEWAWYGDNDTLAVYVRLLMGAAWRDFKHQNITLKRGQIVTSVRKIAMENGITERHARTILDRLKSTHKVTQTAYDQIERLDEYNVLYAAVDELPHDQRETVIEYYFKGLTYKQIDEKHDRTDGSARRLLIKAISTLRKGRTGERLRAVYGVDYGIKHKSLAAFRSSGTSEIEDYVMRRWGNYSPTE